MLCIESLCASSPLCDIQLVWQYMCVALTVKHNYFLADYWKVYNYMFRPYSWAIIRLYHEPSVGYITCYLLVMGVLESCP